jgi:hypothetical protein
MVWKQILQRNLMQVNIVNVNVENVVKGRSRYSKATVQYTWNGEARSQSIMSFSNPSVFKEVQELVGQTVEVETGKNDAGFTEWRSIKRVGDAGSAQQGVPAATGAPATRVSGSNYETRDERAARQVLIVRQSSLGAAVESLTPGAKAALDPKAVIEVAKQFEEYVFATNEEDVA